MALTAGVRLGPCEIQSPLGAGGIGEVYRARKTRLEAWLSRNLLARFEGRILAIDHAIADRWGQITGSLASQGSPLAVIDGLLAATALHHNLTLVTRNSDVARTRVEVFDPWTG